MNNSWHNEARLFRKAKRWPTILLWVGVTFLLAGLLTHQLVGIAVGLIGLGAGGYWMQDILHSGNQGP
jgi:hypothetical protein